MRLIRSLLFAPANRQEMLKKFPRYAADAFAIDLEDGTPENEKAAARDHLPDMVAWLREQHLKGFYFMRPSLCLCVFVFFQRMSEETEL